MYTQPNALPFISGHFFQLALSSFCDPFFRTLSHQYPSIFSFLICASQTIHGPWTQSGGLQPTFSKQIRQDRTYQSGSHTVNVKKKKGKEWLSSETYFSSVYVLIGLRWKLNFLLWVRVTVFSPLLKVADSNAPAFCWANSASMRFLGRSAMNNSSGRWAHDENHPGPSQCVRVLDTVWSNALSLQFSRVRGWI